MEVFEKIVEKLEELKNRNPFICQKTDKCRDASVSRQTIDYAIEIVKQAAEEYVPDTNVGSNGWIPVEERFPEDGDNRFYMCIVENHEEDLPMFCQYEEEYGFGFWNDIYDEHTLGFVDSEFNTNEELGYEKVIAWKPLPEPYQTKGE